MGRKTFFVPSERISSSSYDREKVRLDRCHMGRTYQLQGHKFGVDCDERARSWDLVFSEVDVFDSAWIPMSDKRLLVALLPRPARR